MKINPEDSWENYIELLDRVCATAETTMRKEARLHGVDDRKQLIRSAYNVAQRYSWAAGALAANMFNKIAERSGLHISAEMADTVTLSEVTATVNRVMRMTGSVDELADAIEALVMQCARDTMQKNANKYDARGVWLPQQYVERYGEP